MSPVEKKEEGMEREPEDTTPQHGVSGEAFSDQQWIDGRV